MNNVCLKVKANQISLDYGKVVGQDGPDFMVVAAGETVKARRAVTCLVEPAAGDVVLLSDDDFGRSYVLSILEREEEKVSLVFAGDVEVKVNRGRLQTATRDGFDLVSGGDVSLASPRLEINSLQGDLRLRTLEYLGEQVQGRVKTLKLMARVCDSVVERVTQRAQRSYRWVSELEQIKVGQLHQVVDKVMSLRSKYAEIRASEHVKIDGKRILMG